jgi:hypothetical protein
MTYLRIQRVLLLGDDVLVTLPFEGHGDWLGSTEADVADEGESRVGGR